MARTSLNFAHAETLAPLLGLLGLFEDPNYMSANSPAEAITGRRFRASQAVPFAANLALVLYNVTGSWQVQVLHNERVVPQPMCGDATVCDWEMFKAAQAKHLRMDYHSICTPAATASANDASDEL